MNTYSVDQSLCLPALFIPGLAGHAAEFDALAQLLSGPTLCLDPVYTGDLSIAGQAQHITEQALAAGFYRFVVVGHSQGGLVALELAVSRPDLVAGVVILDSPIQLPPPLRAALRLFTALLRTPVGPSLLRAFYTATFSEVDNPRHRHALLDRLARVPHEAARHIVGAAFGYDSATALNSIQVPALYVKANIPTKLDRLPASVRGCEISGVGHWVHVHRPRDLSRELHQLAVTPPVSEAFTKQPTVAVFPLATPRSVHNGEQLANTALFSSKGPVP
ncbi:alpha/beta fold hydrolase [Nakamurella sp. GG22]